MDTNHESERKKRKSEHEETQLINGLDCLPREVALDIIARLQIKSLLQFRFVCRTWCNLSHHPDLVNLHLSRAERDDIYLIFHCDYPLRNHLCFVEFSDENDKGIVQKFHTPFSAFMPEFRVVSSCNGLLCLSNTLLKDAPYVYNPFTRKYKVLPKSTEFQGQEVVLGFGFHPITREYKVIRIVYHWDFPSRAQRSRRRRRPKSDVQIFSQRSDKWRNIGEIPYRLEQSGGVLVNGRLHWVGRLNNLRLLGQRIIICFDLSDEQFQEVPLPGTNNRRIFRRYSVTVLGGFLCIAYLNHDGLDIWIMKEYGMKDSWVKEFQIPSYIPKALGQEMQQKYEIWKNVLNQTPVQVLCLLKNGEILLQYQWGSLVSYNPDIGRFKNLHFQGMPNIFQTIVHIGSLCPVDAPLGDFSINRELYSRVRWQEDECQIEAGSHLNL